MQLSTDKMYELAVDGVKSGESKAMGKRVKLVFGIAPEDQDMVVNIRGPSAMTTLTADKRISLRAKAKSCPKRKNKSDSKRRKGKDEDEDRRRRRKREDEEGTEEGKKSRRNQSKKKNGNSGDADDSIADGGQVENDQEKKARRKKNVEAGKRVKVRIKTFPSSSFLSKLNFFANKNFSIYRLTLRCLHFLS